MMVTITNEDLGLSAIFMEDGDIRTFLGYDKLYGVCYEKLVHDRFIFKMNSPAGFFENHAPSVYTVKGVNEDGEIFKSNSFLPKTISFQFKNVFTAEGRSLSPNQKLQWLLENKNGVLRVDVETSNRFHQYFYLTDGTSLEAGVIELTTANSGRGMYWVVPGLTYKFYFFEMGGNAYIPKELPQTLLKTIVYPFRFDLLATIQTRPVITINTSYATALKTTIKNTSTGEALHYTNTNLDTTIIIDCDNFTVTNQNGQDRTINLTGDWLLLKAGVNKCEWLVDDKTELEQPYPNNISQDYCIEFEYENVVGSIS